MEIYLWTDKYFEMPTYIKSQIREAKKDRAGFIKKVIKELKSGKSQQKSILKGKN